MFVGRERRVILDIHVDDPLGAGGEKNLNTTLDELKHYILLKEGRILHESVTIKHLARRYTREGRKIRVTLGKKYSDDAVEMARMKGCKPVQTPGTNTKSKEEAAADVPMAGQRSSDAASASLPAAGAPLSKSPGIMWWHTEADATKQARGDRT